MAKDIPVTRISRDAYYMGIAIAVRERANCHGNRVGAIIVLEDRIISTGYNGTPAGMVNCLDGGCQRCANRAQFPSGTGYDLCICVHAEQNALLAAARFGISVSGATLYTTMQPCFGCLKEMLQAGVRSVQYLHPWNPREESRRQYEELQHRFVGDVVHQPMDDPRAEWAVTTKRLAAPSPDETGHVDL